VRATSVALLGFMLSGCFIGDEDSNWASRRQIVAAAERCGVADYEPVPAGGGWAAYVPGEDPDHGPKTNCIYDDLHAQGLRATR
jgi:hypothetical protein